MRRIQGGSEHDHVRPVHVDSISAYPLDTDLVLYDGRDGQSYALNHTGRAIWERCIGDLSVEAIADEIAALFVIPRKQARVDTCELLDALAAAAIIRYEPSMTSVDV